MSKQWYHMGTWNVEWEMVDGRRMFCCHQIQIRSARFNFFQNISLSRCIGHNTLGIFNLDLLDQLDGWWGPDSDSDSVLDSGLMPLLHISQCLMLLVSVTAWYNLKKACRRRSEFKSKVGLQTFLRRVVVLGWQLDRSLSGVPRLIHLLTTHWRPKAGTVSKFTAFLLYD